MQESKKSFSPRFWTSSKQKKEGFSQSDVKSIPDIDNHEQFKDSLPKILSHLQLFFNGHLNYENVKIEFNDHYDSLEISFKRDEKHLTYLREKSCEYKFIIAMKWETTQISVEFKDLYKFLEIMGEQFNFQNSQDFFKTLQPQPNITKKSFLYNSRFFGSNKENITAPVKSNKTIDLRDSTSSESRKSSTESSSVEWQRPNFASVKA